MSQVNLEISPANVASNGKISYKSGNPVLQFIIGEQDRLLMGQSIRLTGTFDARINSSSDGTEAVQSTDELNIDSRLGIYNCIDQVVIKSQKTHQTIEHIRHYNRFCASFLPALNSLEDQVGHLSESALVMPNFFLGKQSVLDIPSQHNTGNAFCCHLPCGLFNGANKIPLSAAWGLGGLLIEIHLAPDENVFYSRDGSDTGLTNAFYELSDVSLVAEAVNPSPEMLSQYSTSGSTMEYNSISSYYSSINSTNSVINFNLGMSRVLGVFCNFLDASNINNRSENGMATQPIVKDVDLVGTAGFGQVNQIVFTKGGTRFPLEYNVDTIHDGVSLSAEGTGSFNGEVDPQVVRNFLSGLRPFSTLGKSGISTNNTFVSNGQGGKGSAQIRETAEGGPIFGVGISYDGISGDGVDFSTQNWGLQMTTGLDTNKPTAVYVFVHSKNTLVFSPTGIQVLN